MSKPHIISITYNTFLNVVLGLSDDGKVYEYRSGEWVIQKTKLTQMTYTYMNGAEL